MKTDPDVKVIEQEGLNVGYLAFNTTKPPFDKKEVRQALQWRSTRRRSSRPSTRAPARRPRTRSRRPSGPTTTRSRTMPYDPEAAKAMLEEAGVTTPLEIELWAMPVQRPYNPNAKRIAEMIQADLAKVGVNAEIVTYEWGEYRKRPAGAASTVTGQLGWTGDNGDPGQLLRPARLRRRPRRRPEHRQVVQQGLRRPDQEGRARLADRPSAPSSTRRRRRSFRRRRLSSPSPTRSSTSRCARR